MSEAPVPKFCTKGCGETLEATRLIEGRIFDLISSGNPDFRHHWKVKCTKCGFDSFISEGKYNGV